MVPLPLRAQGDRPAADIRLAYSRTKDAQEDGAKEGLEAPPGQTAAPQRRGVHIRFIWSQKTRNYIRRMVPHILGWFPISAAWVMIINALETARHDLADVSEEEIPPWVLGAIYGTLVIFWSFTVIQILFQWYSPGYYCKAWPLKPIALQRGLTDVLWCVNRGFGAHLLRVEPHGQAVPWLVPDDQRRDGRRQRRECAGRGAH